MSIKIISRQYTNQFYEPMTLLGFTFRQRTNWLLGNVGEWFNLELEFEILIDFNADMSNTVTVDNYNNKFILNNGRKWQDYGFDLGDEVTLTYNYLHDANNDGIWGNEQITIQFTITNIYDNTIETDTDIDLTPFSTIPTNYGNKKIENVRFVVLKEIEGLHFKYNLLENANIQSHNLHSLIDGEITEFKLNDLNNLPVNQNVDMIPLQKQSGMAVKNVKLMKYNDTSSQNDAIIKSQNASSFTLKPNASVPAYTGIRQAKSIKMPVVTSLYPEYKSQQSVTIPYETLYSSSLNNQYIDGNPNGLFLLNAPSSDLKYFDINVDFKLYEIGGNQPHSGNQNDKLRLVLFQYENGNALNFKNKIVLKEWTNTATILNNVENFNQIVGIDISENDSLSLAFEYEIDNRLSANYIHFYVKIETQNAEVKVLNNSGKNKFKISVEFLLHNFFKEITDLTDNTLPAYFSNQNALTDIFEIIALPKWNNPNTRIISNMSEIERLGNTGWFDENFNGFQNPFSISELNYFDELGNAITSLDYTKPTIIKTRIKGFQSVTQNMKVGFGFAYIPLLENEYKHKTENYLQNLFINTGKEYPVNALDTAFDMNENVGNTIFEGNGINSAKMNMQGVDNFIVKPVGQNEIEIIVKLIPTPEFVDLFEQKADDDRKYILWANVADDIGVINKSNRVSLLLDVNDMQKNIIPAGEYQPMTVSFLEHWQNENDAGKRIYKGFVEDDVLTKLNFDINKTNQKLKSISYGYYVKNINTGLIYKLENFSFNTSNFPIDATGVQQINIDESRNFKLPDNNNKNWIKLFVDNVINDTVTYQSYFATKLRWEDWLKRDDVPNEFYNQSLKHNGFNNDWLHYLHTQGHKIYFFIDLEIQENQDIKYYRNEYEIDFNGYDENVNIGVEYNFYRFSDNTLINGGIDQNTNHNTGNLLLDEPTKIEVTFTNQSGDLDANKTYGIIGIEIKEGAGEMQFFEISSVWDVEIDNILLNLPNETRLKIEQVNNNSIKLSCLIDNTKLTGNTEYKISARIGCLPNGTGAQRLYEGRYELKYE